MSNYTLATAKISQLHATETNVRKVKHSAEKISQIAGSILSVGLIHPLAVVARSRKKKGFDVIAGEGRRQSILRAIELSPELAEAEWPIAIYTDASKATEVSLAENHAREQMRLAEVYQGFADIRAQRPNASLEEIGAIFGYDAARAGRIMRLANLAPQIMSAYVAGDINDAQAAAYAATEDRALQVQVFESIPQSSGAANIKRALDVGNADLTPKLRFVGVDAYLAAGGEFEADLLSLDPHEGRILNPAILNELTEQKISDEKAAFAAKLVRNGMTLADGADLITLGFAWADAAPKIKEHGYERTDYELRIDNPKRGPVPEAEAARYQAIEDRLAELSQDEPSAEEEDEIEALTAEREQIEAGSQIILPDTGGAVVGIANLDREGDLIVNLWYADRDEAGLSTRKGAKSVKSSDAPVSPAEAERARFGLSKDNMQGMMLLRRDVIRAELFNSASAGSTLALEFLLFTQARTILRGKKTYMGTYYPGADTGTFKLASDFDDVPGKQREWIEGRPEHNTWTHHVEEMRAEPWAAAHDPIEGFALFRAEGEATRARCAALIAGHSLLASTSHYSEGRTPRMVRELANLIEAEPGFGRWRDAMDMDEAFFSTMSHKARLSLLEQWGLAERAKGMKAKETPAFCARIVNCDEADAKLLSLHPDDVAEAVNWLPDFLATGPVEPLPAPKASADAGDVDTDPFDGSDDDDDQDFGGDDEFDAANDDAEGDDALAAE